MIYKSLTEFKPDKFIGNERMKKSTISMIFKLSSSEIIENSDDQCYHDEGASLISSLFRDE